MKWVGELGSHHTYLAAFIPNLLHYPMLAQHPLLVKYTKLMGCTSVVTIIPNFALFSYFTTHRFHNQVYPHLVRVLENGLRDGWWWWWWWCGSWWVIGVVWVVVVVMMGGGGGNDGWWYGWWFWVVVMVVMRGSGWVCSGECRVQNQGNYFGSRTIITTILYPTFNCRFLEYLLDFVVNFPFQTAAQLKSYFCCLPKRKTLSHNSSHK